MKWKQKFVEEYLRTLNVNSMKQKNSDIFDTWETILESEWLGVIDSDVSSSTVFKKTHSRISTVMNGNTSEYNSEYSPESNFEKKFPQYSISIDYDSAEISVYTKKWKIPVGCIGVWKVPNFEEFKHEEHLMFEVYEQFRGTWLALALYKLYTDIAKTHKNFVIPHAEYISSPSLLRFYIKNEIFDMVEIYDSNEGEFRELSEREIVKYMHNNEDKLYDEDGNIILLKLSEV